MDGGVKTSTHTHYVLRYNEHDSDLSYAIRRVTLSINPDLDRDPKFTSIKAAEEFCKQVLLTLAEGWTQPTRYAHHTIPDGIAVPRGLPVADRYEQEYRFVGEPELSRGGMYAEGCHLQISRKAEVREVAVQVTCESVLVDGVESTRETLLRTPSPWRYAPPTVGQIGVSRVELEMFSL